ncbi:hypothetical protein GTQ99_00200 [Kineococcus sp. T13]|uniref:hypothetical protein n=1 Tax=Kineococcus vitellinus TaxID=2696565 RepID=UPI0014130B24|nr:hypothetical protein [Kineococcus vitellinus]NAZ73851.1 hypothetical protein [Kineococcus vitellinus]
MALILGADPLTYLKAPADEVRVLNEVIEQALAMDSERRQQEIDAIGIAVGNAVGRVFGGSRRGKGKRKG